MARDGKEMAERFLVPVDSVSFFEALWWCWSILGINTTCNKYICGFYDLLLNVFVTIFYPIHLTIGLLMEPNIADIFSNLSITIPCIACSLKHYLFRWKLKQIRQVERILGELDERALTNEERFYFNNNTKVGAKRTMRLFFGAYSLANVTATSAVLLAAERRLMYPAWFPFDWQASPSLYWVAAIYQFVGISIQITQNLANDIYIPLILCLLSGQVRLLTIRVAKLGHDLDKSNFENELELRQCIEDHKKLLDLSKLVEKIISYPQLVQYLASALNICFVLIYILFFVDNISAYAYYIIYFLAVSIEIFPCSYYGSLLQIEFERLPYALFESNWLMQSRKFNQNIRIFSELSLKKVTAVAGGIITIHLNAFFATCKMAYSLFAVVIRMK